MSTRWEDIARAGAGDDYARVYADRFRRMAARGEDIHGEATYVAALVAPPARVLDAGCGTGRVAVRLHELGYDVTGVDGDASMVEVAAAEAPGLDWRVADLASLSLDAVFDLVVLAGNTVPLLDPGTLEATCERVAAHAAPAALVVCGFGLNPAHLPGDCPVTPLVEVDAAMAAAGLSAASHHGTWTGEPFDPAGSYVVATYRRA